MGLLTFQDIWLGVRKILLEYSTMRSHAHFWCCYLCFFPSRIIFSRMIFSSSVITDNAMRCVTGALPLTCWVHFVYLHQMTCLILEHRFVSLDHRLETSCGLWHGQPMAQKCKIGPQGFAHTVKQQQMHEESVPQNFVPICEPTMAITRKYFLWFLPLVISAQVFTFVSFLSKGKFN